MSLHLNISAGELFELIRPVVLALSAMASIWVLASARQRRFPVYLATAWALGTLFFPLIILPIYLIVRSVRKRRKQGALPKYAAQGTITMPRWRIALPLAYAAIVLSSIALYLYWDYQSVDAHLARATQARVRGQRGRTIDEYRAALSRQDDPHTHKLLAIELADTGDWTEALSEFRLAEQGGEPDDSIPFNIATLLDSINHPFEAALEYQRFLRSDACTQPLPDRRCAEASMRVENSRIRN